MSGPCGVLVTLTEAEVLTATSLLGGSGDSDDQARLACEIERDHLGRHQANFNARGSDEVWAEWDDGNPIVFVKLRESDMCPAVGPGDDLCLFPSGHAGVHDFQLTPVLTSWRHGV